jgi:hypothetical protein
MVDAPGAGVDHKAVDLADSLAIRADDIEAVEAHHRFVHVSRIEIPKP